MNTVSKLFFALSACIGTSILCMQQEQSISYCYGLTLRQAVESGDPSLVARKLHAMHLKNQKIDTYEDGIHTALHLACIYKNQEDPTSPPPTLFSTKKFYRRDFTKIVHLLIQFGANINALTRGSSDTPLHIAVRYGNMDHIRLLLDYGASINSINKLGNTPLDEHMKQIIAFTIKPKKENLNVQKIEESCSQILLTFESIGDLLLTKGAQFKKNTTTHIAQYLAKKYR